MFNISIELNAAVDICDCVIKNSLQTINYFQSTSSPHLYLAHLIIGKNSPATFKTCEQIHKYLLPRRRLSIIHITLFTKQAALSRKGEKSEALKIKIQRFNAKCDTIRWLDFDTSKPSKLENMFAKAIMPRDIKREKGGK